MEPNKRNIRKWVKALRSGKFRQGQGVLVGKDDNRHTTYCCLGVACVVAGEKPKDLKEFIRLTKHTMAWLGLSLPNPKIGESTYAIDANDRKGLSFRQIADLIEKRYLS